jgi:hypothetical protein
MPFKLSTTIGEIQNIPNSRNIGLVNEFVNYMTRNGSSENHQNNNLKVVIAFANFLGNQNSFYAIKTKAQVLEFLEMNKKQNILFPRISLTSHYRTF